MTPKETLKKLATLLEGEPSLEVATIARAKNKADPPEARILNLSGDAEQQFRKIIDNAVGADLDPLKWTLKKFDPIYKPEPGGVEIEWIKLDKVPAVGQASDRLDNLAGLAGFDGSDSAYIGRLAYWGAAIGDEDDRAYVFRRLSASAELKRKRSTAMVLRSGTFHLVEDKIFLFDEEIDCVVYGNYIFVLRKRDYRSIFEQMKQVFEKARSAANDLHAKLPISNFSEFQDACGTDSRLADKVLAVRGRTYFDELSYTKVKPVIEEFSLDIPTAKDKDGQIELTFRSAPDERFRILRLVDDDYLRSSMTDIRYEVNSKSEET
jgi:hypothetical protein